MLQYRPSRDNGNPRVGMHGLIFHSQYQQQESLQTCCYWYWSCGWNHSHGRSPLCTVALEAKPMDQAPDRPVLRDNSAYGASDSDANFEQISTRRLPRLNGCLCYKRRVNIHKIIWHFEIGTKCDFHYDK